MSSSPEVVLITGANTGLGFETVRARCGSNTAYSIILAGRSLQKVEDAVKTAQKEFPSSHSQIHPLQVDIESDESIDLAFKKVEAEFGTVDTLVNNAGASFDQLRSAGNMTERQIWNQSWNVNTAGTQVMTWTFVPLLLKSKNPRLLFITSGTSTLHGAENSTLAVDKRPPQGWPKQAMSIAAYRSSKTGMNMMMREWHRTLVDDGVKVWCISPGLLATGLGGNQEALKKMGAGDPAIGGAFIRDVIEGKRDADVGKVVNKDGVQPW